MGIPKEKTHLDGRKKKTAGRQKIEIKKIDNISNRHVTFSKRRVGLFKKASELCILTGAEIAIVVQSPGKRLFSFGHPSAELVVERFLGGGEEDSGYRALPANTHDYNRHYWDACRELEVEKKRKEAIEAAKGNAGGREATWWDDVVDGMGVEELEQYLEALEELAKTVMVRANDVRNIVKSSTILPAAFPEIGAACDETASFLNQNQMVTGAWRI